MSAVLATAFTLWGAAVSWAELLAFVLSLAMVVCNARVNPAGWPLAAAASLLYFAVFWNSRLYGEASLQIFFATLALWGWRQWLHARTAEGTALPVRHLGRRDALMLGAALLAAWPLLGAALQRFTDTDVPYLDALPTAGSVAGQWLLGRKYVQNWPVWLGVNLFSVGLFAYKGLWLTTLLYALFALLSLWGWRAWRRLAVDAAP